MQLYVNDRASYTALRGERTLENAKQALVRAQAIDGADCSPEHMGQMGQVAVDAHSIEDVGYFRVSVRPPHLPRMSNCKHHRVHVNHRAHHVSRDPQLALPCPPHTPGLQRAIQG
ncbi:CSS-motif domain-containing protein [Comamonas sp. 7D-2evo1]|uniref:CSS-motif domain-containing protein n=1 Tax=Comamonas sp. 7D-2evo1 TaxID=2927787 RepID=UPI00351E1722